MKMMAQDGVVLLELKNGLIVEIHPDESLTITGPGVSTVAECFDFNVDALQRIRVDGVPLRDAINHHPSVRYVPIQEAFNG